MAIIVDEEQLARIAKSRKFDPRTLEIARRLFLNHEKPKRLSAEYGVIFQRIYAIRRAVLKAIEAEGLEPGWSQVTLRGPKAAIEAAQRAFAQRMARL